MPQFCTVRVSTFAAQLMVTEAQVLKPGLPAPPQPFQLHAWALALAAPAVTRTARAVALLSLLRISPNLLFQLQRFS